MEHLVTSSSKFERYVLRSSNMNTNQPQFQGSLPLVIEAHNADIIATLITVKQQTEIESGHSIRMTITGASEAHLLAKELANARVGIILSPSRPFPLTWEQRRM